MHKKQIPHGPDDLKCPLWKEKMSKVCHSCPLWVLVRGKDPQTNADVDRWDCALSFIPMLQVQTIQAHLRTTASVDELRKEVHHANNQQMVGAIAQLNERMHAAAVSGNGHAQPLIEKN